MPPTAAELRDMLAHRDVRGLRVFLEETHPGNVADALAQLEPREIIQALRTARRDRAIEVFEFFSDETQADIFGGMARKEMAEFLEEMSPDDRADLIKHLNPDLVESVLALVAQVDREDIRKLSSYREGTAGAVMTTEYACLEEHVTVAKALEQLRVQAPNRETIYYIYVIDNHRRLVGSVELKDLIVARPATQKTVSEVMERDVVSVRINDDPIEVARTIAKYNFIAVPVVDAANRLVGIITVDDAMDLLDPLADDPSASGKEGAKASVLGYVDRVAWATTRQSSEWVCLIALCLLCAWLVMGESVPGGPFWALAATTIGVPFLIALGRRPGARCAAATARDLAGEHPPFRSWLRSVAEESKLGVLAPLVFILAIFGIFLLRSGDGPKNLEGLLVAAALAAVAQVVVAALLGGAAAVLAHAAGMALDRLVAPLLLSVPDALALLVYALILLPRFPAAG
jgi:magnesium transporter